MKTKLILSGIVFIIGFVFSDYAQEIPIPVRAHETLKQNPPAETQESHQQPQLNSGSGGALSMSDLGKESSLFFIDTWEMGQLVLKDKTIIKDRLYRYNMCTQQMEFINEGDTLAIAIPEEIESLSFADHTFVFEEYEKNGQVKKAYFELLVDGKCKLLVYRWITYKYVEDMDDCGARYASERNFLKEEYYVSKDDHTAILIPESKRRFVEMMSDKDIDMKSYMKVNKLKVCREDDLEKLISYYNAN